MPIDQTTLEADFLAQEQAMARHTITVVKALISNALGLHEVDYQALANKVSSINSLLDGDEASEGYQAFAALITKLSTVEATSVANAAAIANLQAALTNQIATLTSRVDTVESEARTGRDALDARITTLNNQYTTHVASVLVKNAEQDTRLDDHQARIEALEASKVLVEARLATLETDNTANKSAIAQNATNLAAQSAALQSELLRAQTAEGALQSELATERARIDGLVTTSGDFATRQNVADAGEVGAMAFCNKLWSEAGIAMPAGLAMPDGTISV